jgi:orotidine-5'-phosphate decarboxylase
MTSMTHFALAIMEATQDLVCGYKINTAFYEAYGAKGWEALSNIMNSLRTLAPQAVSILDAKRADIGHTNEKYAQMAFNDLRADAITVNPYLGEEALRPFLDRSDKGVIVLCRTSNPGAREFQDLTIHSYLAPGDNLHLFELVARRVTQDWNKNGNCALVVGATHPNELHRVRQIVGDMPILIPGIGAQGGDLGATISAGKNSRQQGMIINSSRGIIATEAVRSATTRELVIETIRANALTLNLQISNHLFFD